MAVLEPDLGRFNRGVNRPKSGSKTIAKGSKDQILKGAVTVLVVGQQAFLLHLLMW